MEYNMILHGITENLFIYTTEELLINVHHSRIQNYSQGALVTIYEVLYD
jgi:hypothetical protein